ncbi:S-layer homology domain-containing protein [Paenisporosarcina indica]|uniref:S-layer homology domain-containing protein n=1 Tax=Paenisporosarcina indica TaxID=650093 RepID=UPI00094FD5AB|nr:S-layer homology domain-containing protein [Paenisporosarcina indica]
MNKKFMVPIALMSSLTFSTLISSPTELLSGGQTHVEAATVSPILITELLPNSNNVADSSTDAYEFIELYNNSTQTIDLKNYKLVYGYPDGKMVDWTFKEDKAIAPGETLVIWVKNKENTNLTLADFNTEFNTQLSDSQFTYIESDGMANTAERTLSVADTSNNIFTSATYVKTDVGVNKGIQYKVGQDGKTMDILTSSESPTPGVLIDGQAPATPIDEDKVAPVIAHQAIEKVVAGENFNIKAVVTDETKLENVKLAYKLTEDGSWLEKDMIASIEENTFEVHIDQAELLTNKVTYRIEAFDGQNTAMTEEYEVVIEGMVYDPQSVPALLVTELVPDSTNVGSLDGYEFIEVYNNSTEAINLKDYKIRYRYPAEGPEADLIWKADKEDIILPSGKTIVYWIKNADNQEKTVADFNQFYKVNLVKNVDITEIQSGGMANSSHRGLAIATNTGIDMSAAYYYDQPDVDDTVANKGILYTFPSDGKSVVMKKYSYGIENATPGSLSSIQIPKAKVKVNEDHAAPSLTDLTEAIPTSGYENLDLSFDVTDEAMVKTVRLFYRTNETEEYRMVDLTKTYDSTVYTHTVPSPDLIGKEKLSYYVQASDGINEVTSKVKDIEILSDDSVMTGLNVEDGSYLSKTVLLKAYGKDSKLLIDQKDVTAETKPALPTQAYFAFDAKNVNLYFKNGVTIGDETLHIFDDTINTYTTLTIPVNPNHFTQGLDTKISIRAGTKVSPFDTDSEENRDDFYVKNVRLVLADGTTLYDPSYNDIEKELSVGDGASAKPVIDFSFHLPDEKFTAKAFTWDTTSVNEGTHTVEAQDAENTKAEVIVDNSAPIITPSIEEGKEYKGSFTIQAEVEDKYSSVESLTALLDGKEITLPFETSSAKLTPGEHTVSFTAKDVALNEVQKDIHFTVMEEKPYTPEIISPVDGAENVNPNNTKLQVKVTDPTNDDLDVSFYEGHKFEADAEEITVYENSSDREPPKELIPAGESIVTAKDKMAKVDGEYIETTSLDKFPYHRFEVAVGEEIDEDDEIVLNWEGKSLIGRKVSMYVWNHVNALWELQEWKVAKDNQNFTLHGSVIGKEFVQDGKVQVMVQDEIASTTEFDYSFIWMSDTQYYSESYPHIFDRMTTWMAEEKEKLNLKYVFHTGDLVDEADQPVQWERADTFMGTLDDAAIPYGVLAGNHDVGHKTGDYEEYSKYFGEQRFVDKDYYGESYKNNRGHYDLISSNGNDFIMMYMGWGVNEEDIAWMNAILAKYPEKKAILSFHEYLLVSGNRSPIGEKVFNEVVKTNKNVIATLSGHYHDAETLVDEIDDDLDGTTDRKVYQMLADYQGGPEGGQGFLRLMKVNPVENTIQMQTYSPYLDQYNYYNPVDYPGKDEFTIETDLTPKEKVVATDMFKAEVFTNELIDEVENITDGSIVDVNWNHLERSTKHGWYVQVKDSFGGEMRSDVSVFTTGNQEIDNGGNDGGPITPPAPIPPVTDEQVINVTEGQMTKSDESWTLNQTPTSENTIWVIPKQVIDNAIVADRPLRFVTKNGHEIKVPVDAAKQLQQRNQDSISIVSNVKVEKEANLPAGERYSDIVDISLVAGNQKINSLKYPIELKLKLSQPVNQHVTTAVFYNNTVNTWAYAGGKVENGYWTVSTKNPSMFTVMSANVAFKDTTKHWAKNEIDSIASRFITEGKTAELFAPEQKLTRAEFAVLLVRALQVPLEEYKGTFKDVPSSKKWAAQQIEAAHRTGIVNGKGDGSFDPDSYITREQMAAMMMRAVDYSNPELTKNLPQKDKFKDDSKISNYAKEAVSSASKLGLINGRSNGVFDPKMQTTRAETAVVLYRMLDKLNSVEK